MDSQILFENEFVPTEEDIREYVAQQHLPERSGLIVLGTILTVALIIAAWALVHSITSLLESTIVHLIFGILLIIAISLVSRVIKIVQFNALVRKFERKNKDDLVGFRTFFYEGGFETNGRAYKYADIKNVLYGRTCLFLIVKDAPDVMIKDDINAFKTGEHEKFWEFLDSKVEIQEETKKQHPLSLFRE